MCAEIFNKMIEIYKRHIPCFNSELRCKIRKRDQLRDKAKTIYIVHINMLHLCSKGDSWYLTNNAFSVYKCDIFTQRLSFLNFDLYLFFLKKLYFISHLNPPNQINLRIITLTKGQFQAQSLYFSSNSTTKRQTIFVSLVM